MTEGGKAPAGRRNRPDRAAQAQILGRGRAHRRLIKKCPRSSLNCYCSFRVFTAHFSNTALTIPLNRFIRAINTSRSAVGYEEVTLWFFY